MFYVYILKSISHRDRIYIGQTQNLDQRLKTHNSGGSIHTRKYMPWELIVYLVFKDKSNAIAFEKYLKSQSGRAFIAKRLLPY